MTRDAPLRSITRSFACEITQDEAMPIEFWRINTPGGVEGAILERPAAAPPERSGTNAVVISMQVESYDTTADAIHRKRRSRRAREACRSWALLAGLLHRHRGQHVRRLRGRSEPMLKRGPLHVRLHLVEADFTTQSPSASVA